MVRRCVWSSLIAKVSITTGYYCNNMPPPSSFESSSTVSERSGAPLTASCRKTLFCTRTEAFKQLYPQRLSQWLNAEPNRGRGQYNLRFLRPYSFLDPTRARFEAAARDLSTVRVRYREPKTAIPKEPSDYTEFVDKWTYDGTSWMMQSVEESDAPNTRNRTCLCRVQRRATRPVTMRCAAAWMRMSAVAILWNQRTIRMPHKVTRWSLARRAIERVAHVRHSPSTAWIEKCIDHTAQLRRTDHPNIHPSESHCAE